ncbi:hypothetical protein OOT00_04730 [Desulfobotulus sp. H1]|uniref:ATP-binding protein n=1 Tax=Desulfobotulus pelophilus TaxID=2823377 RepID=A0ABT3N762_9BACT|nr:hypothetical protein [Desulfobotulus pelophilus]MCW7753289.1 hypothetical protein [Desulfobotulus pelophilus]
MNTALPLLHIHTSTKALAEIITHIELQCRNLLVMPAVSHKMQLAAEEVSTALPENTPLSIQVQERADRITLRLTCPPVEMDLAAFNLAWRPDLEKEASGLGLALASRWVDSFSLERDGSGRLHMLFSVEKIFAQNVPAPQPLNTHSFYRLIRPTPGTMAVCGQRLFHHLRNRGFTAKNFHPAKLSALTEEGRLFGALAETESGHICGAAFCIPDEGRLLTGYGPFVFSHGERQRMAADLACHCLERVGRKPFSGVLTRLFDEDCFPKEYFIPAGGHSGSGRRPAWHFPLSDDAGGSLHYTPEIATFIEAAVSTQDLPRKKILMEKPLAEARGPSVFSTALHRKEKRSRMRLLMGGEDMASNIQGHLEWLQKEGIEFCEMHLDLAIPEEASLIPALSRQNFTPVLLLPGGGAQGDLLILETRLHGKGDLA